MSSKKLFLQLPELITEITITNAFIGSTKNMYIVEEQFYTLKHILLGQYLNYLGQLAFCIELGLKNIIKITNKVTKSHDLEFLFLEADKETGNSLSKKFFSSYKSKNEFKKEFLDILKITKNLYEEARYSYGNSLIPFFSNKYLVKDDIVDFEKIISKNKPIRMLKLFLEELGEYHNYVHMNSILNTGNLTDPMPSIIKAKFEIQENISVGEK
jgi:hypothetical protein